MNMTCPCCGQEIIVDERSDTAIINDLVFTAMAKRSHKFTTGDYKRVYGLLARSQRNGGPDIARMHVIEFLTILSDTKIIGDHVIIGPLQHVRGLGPTALQSLKNAFADSRDTP